MGFAPIYLVVSRFEISMHDIKKIGLFLSLVVILGWISLVLSIINGKFITGRSYGRIKSITFNEDPIWFLSFTIIGFIILSALTYFAVKLFRKPK